MIRGYVYRFQCGESGGRVTIAQREKVLDPDLLVLRGGHQHVNMHEVIAYFHD